MEIKEHIEQILQGNPEAFEVIVRLYEKKIFSFCYFMLGNRQEAEDAAQEVFFKAYRNLESYRHESDDLFLAWLYKIASNHCSTLLKRKQRWHLLMPLFRSDGSEKSAEQVFSDQTYVQLQLLKGLTASEREILALRVLEDRPFQDISAILGISSAAIRKRYERIKAKLKKNQSQMEDARYEQRFEY
ncbi:hypothetical protein A7K91_20100 [Paenibacillus oryzae]|uniref:RNA polymerase n=1 Tax=Paenibacillus oryzae TaxID=1844972 RepID=A0A1A5YI64_9BACL|nr:sigma-70 family RNA polymerase sigma factor [Paenibacillus oryzae]OBR65287.1 hypothetical protein A7K91_20100 [Paenibacillus oryzae]